MLIRPRLAVTRREGLVVSLCILGITWLLVACSGGDDTSKLRQEIESQSSQIASLQTALAPTATPISQPTPTPRPTFIEVEVPLFRNYIYAVGSIAQITPPSSLTYSAAVKNAQLQAALDNAFRRAQEILRTAPGYMNGSDGPCAGAVTEWARFATDYWNSLARAASDKVPSRWTYATNFVTEVLNEQQRLAAKCPSLISALSTPTPGVN